MRSDFKGNASQKATLIADSGFFFRFVDDIGLCLAQHDSVVNHYFGGIIQ
jgi:hypothetical protein